MPLRALPVLFLFGSVQLLPAVPLINEIEFHPPHAALTPEVVAQEWFEVHNPDPTAVDAGGWRITKGVTFTVPAGTTIPGNGYLVIASNVAAFQASHPGFAGLVVGGWTGRLSNAGESIRIEDTAGVQVDEVDYADDGDWALRARGPLSFSHRGWVWISPADGGGRTLELRNPALGNGNGQNWGMSTTAGGTPGAANSLTTTNVAPLISSIDARPEIPRSTDPIVISCRLEDESASTTATLWWRLDAQAWQDEPMADSDGDGDVEATINPQPNLAVIEFYVSATDGALTRTWPAPARTSNPGVLPETFAQAANALIQVDNGFNAAAEFRTPGNQPIYRLIMTDAERAELAQIGSTSGQEDSEAAMNGTFISHDGTGVSTRFRCSFRNRGLNSALGPPNNYNVAFPHAEPWHDRTSMQLNCQYPHSQALGAALFLEAGIAPQDAAVVRVRVNGADLAQTGARMYGRYARVEPRGGDWAERHFPNDPDGNLYRLDDHAYPQGDPRSGEFLYEGSDSSDYSDTFFKETNEDEGEDGWSDLINFCRVVSAPATGGTLEQPAISDAAYPAAVEAVLNLEHFYRYIATDALIGNQEGGLQTGRGDDCSMYRGLVDQRFFFVPHDLDAVFGLGTFAGNPVTRSIFSYDGQQPSGGSGGLSGMPRLFNHPHLVPRYYAAVLEQLDSWFTSANIDPIIDHLLGVDDLIATWVPAATITNLKNFVGQRRANVLAQIQQNYSLSIATNAADFGGFKRTSDGSVTFSGTFNVAQTYSITVNGAPAQMFYRPSGPDAAGTWRFAVGAGSPFLSPGLNRVVVNFRDQPGGQGRILESLTADVLNQPVTATYTNVSGTLTGAPLGSLTATAPSSYVPGLPFLVRVDQLNASGNLDRESWTTTATLSATNGLTLTPNTITLFNGMGSALVTASGGTGGSVTYLSTGSGGTGTTNTASGTPGSTWRVKHDLTTATIGSFPAAWKNEGFDDSAWITRPAQTGYGDADENQSFPLVDYDPGTAGTQAGPAYLFRNTFTITDLTQLASVTGEVTFDDACAVYVNGTEVYRTTPDLSANAPLSQYSEANTTTTRENATAPLTVPLNLLHNGANTIAVEVHQHDPGSSDVTFNLRLQGNFSASDPGNFTLNVTSGPLNASKAIASLGTPLATDVTGTLPAGVTNWSGVVRLTGDTTVPAGATLNIQPGTHILVAGTPFGSGGSAGTDLINMGTINANGTAANPISITCSNAANRWGEIRQSGAGVSTWRYALITRAAHSPGGGHTGTGPIFRLAGTTILFEDCVLSDSPGKSMTNSGSANITFRRCHLARGVMGPELDASTITVEDSNLTDMLPIYRESGGPDDEDCIYIHDSGGRPVNLRRVVLANCGDDALDCLGGTLTVEDTIIRNAFDKGASLLNNNATLRRCRFIDNDIGVSTKVQVGGTETTPFLNLLENCTIVSENHPTNTGDGDFHSIGVHTRNKYGTTTMNITVRLKNCIISAEEPVRNDYGTGGNPFPLDEISYSCYQDLGGANPADPVPAGTGNIQQNPLYVSAAGKDFHLQAASPCRDTGDPTFPNDTDGSRSDMGALPYSATSSQPGTITWTLGGSPYRVTDNVTVPPNVTLVINPGVSVYFDQNRRMTVNGRLMAVGSPGARIVFSHVPGVVAPGDADPIKNGVQTGPPKWGGVRIIDSLTQESTVKYCDFINAQGTDPATSENWGSLGFIRAWGLVEHCTWSGTHLRMCYGRNCKLTVAYSTFPDMFLPDPILNRIEEPNDFLAAADNRMEPLKVEYPTTDPEVNNPNFPNGLPAGGWWRVYFNEFHGNRGHQDVFDADSGRWGQPGQFVLDCRYNYFHGLAGDEHIDLGGDVYVASNVFERATKDIWTIDTGYSNALSSGDKGAGTTITVARNLFFDLDHAINCKVNTATIFEHNTAANFHADFLYDEGGFQQDVKCSVVNVFIPEDGPNPTVGDGGYLGYNLLSNIPRLISGADSRKVNDVVVHDITTKLEFYHNLVDQITETAIGANHPVGIFNPAYGINTPGAPHFVDPDNRDYSLAPGSAARGTAPGGLDYGWTIPEWAYIIGGPPPQTALTSATFTVGGPGIVAYKWRLNGGAWSARTIIGAGGIFPRSAPAVRQGTIVLNGLTNGVQTLEVLGEDMAGNWQDADPARTLAGMPQAAPTVRTWTVNTSLSLILINEVVADAGTGPDVIELWNGGGTVVNLAGWALSDDPSFPQKYVIPSGTLAPGNFLVLPSTTTGINLDNDGDMVQLVDGALQVQDSVAFGFQPAGFSIGRVSEPAGFTWVLGTATPGAANARALLGDSRDLRINEFVAGGKVLYKDDWLELQNPGALPVALDGLVLTDNLPGDPTAHSIAPLSFVGPGGFVKFIADGQQSAGPNHVDFQLDSQQEEIALLDSAGGLIDRLVFYPQTDDYSQATDAGGQAVYYELPTGGFANGTGDPGYANALAIVRGLRITELMYNAAGGNDFDWLELRNVGATSLNLSTARFVEGIDFQFGSLVLGPGQNVVLVANLAAFNSRYGVGANIGGTYTGRLDNGGETLILQLPAPFDAAVMCFRYEDDWYPDTDGQGPSLELVSTATPPEDFGERNTWRESPLNGGTPDGRTISQPTTYAQWLTFYSTADGADDDGDGMVSVIEFGLGLDPQLPGAPNGIDRAPAATLTAGGRMQLQFTLPENATLMQSHGQPEITYAVQVASALSGWTTLATKTPSAAWTPAGSVVVGAASGGRVPISVTDTAGLPANGRRFIRLRVTWAP